MIYVNMKGNLGNQMFEYACARQLQEKTGQKICLNTCLMQKYKPEYTFDLEDFILNENVVIERNKKLPWYINTYTGVIRIFKGLFPQMFFTFMKHFGVFIWLQSTYIEIPDIKKENYYIEGYWQSERYFKDVDEIVRKEFEPRHSLKKENEDLYNTICDTESICVTIRRGDYVTNEKYKKKFFLCDKNFFLEAVRKIKQKIPSAVVIVFSDDVEWVKKNIDFGTEAYYESGKDPVWEKIRLMAACKHFVISNSSFSWWVQHLSMNPDKIVYAPSRWYPDRRKCDIYEENWNYIEV